MAKFRKLDVPYQWKDEFTKYPHGYTIFEALCKWVKQVDNMVDNINNWNDYLDNFVETFEFELQEEVQSTISRWQNEGLLDEIIASALDTELNNVKEQLSETEQEIRERAVNVKDFGAVGDGLTKDSDAIQQAIDYAYDNKYGVVFIPRGVYLIDKTINIDAHELELVGTGVTSVLKKHEDLGANDIIRSIREERVKVTSSLHHLVLRNFAIDGVDRMSDGIHMSWFARSCAIIDVKIDECKNGIYLENSFSFSLLRNNLRGFSECGIKFSEGVDTNNVYDLNGNAIRHAEIGLYAPNMRTSSIVNNTFEMNRINAIVGGNGVNIRGNYIAGEGFKLGSNIAILRNSYIGGNFVSAGYDQGVAEYPFYLDNLRACTFESNHIINSKACFRLDNNSVVEWCKFNISDFQGIEGHKYFYNVDTGESDLTGAMLGKSNVVERLREGYRKYHHLPANEESGSTVVTQIFVGNELFYEEGKLSQYDNEYRVRGNATRYRIDMPLYVDSLETYGKLAHNGLLGFFGATPISRKGVTGTTADEKIDSLIQVLKQYGLISP